MLYEDAMRCRDEQEKAARTLINEQLPELLDEVPDGEVLKDDLLEYWQQYSNENDPEKQIDVMQLMGNCAEICSQASKDRIDFDRSADPDECLHLSGLYADIAKLAHNLTSAREKAYLLSDSKPVHIDGTLIITDPCYILRREDWLNIDQFGDMSTVGIPTSAMRSTIYGDWCCNVYDTDTGDDLGRFCADGASVCVAAAEEVDAYDPEFRTKYGGWCYTVIDDFQGDVIIEVRNEDDEYGPDVTVCGDGIHISTGEPFNFESRQTGF